MKDNLKNRFNEEDFDSNPLEGHEERFKTKLLIVDKTNEGNTKTNYIFFVAAAAVLAILLSVVFFQTDKQNQLAEEIHEEKLELADFSFEASEKEKYFKKEISSRKEEFSSTDGDLKPLLEQLNVLENSYEILEQKLIKNFNNENLISALLNNYKLRLELLEKIQKIIQFKNKIKDNSHEKNTNNKG